VFFLRQNRRTPVPDIVDPTGALVSFQQALRAGVLQCQRGEVDREIVVYRDTPEGGRGEMRLTYARVAPGPVVKALAIVTPVEPIAGLPTFQIGYAVPQAYRRKGLAKGIVEAAIAELKSGMGRQGMKEFWVEAIVGANNEASKKVCEATLSKVGKPTTDGLSGNPALQYARKVE
jgi:hypothetical protein